MRLVLYFLRDKNFNCDNYNKKIELIAGSRSREKKKFRLEYENFRREREQIFTSWVFQFKNSSFLIEYLKFISNADLIF